jgi:hypothetical protein
VYKFKRIGKLSGITFIVLYISYMIFTIIRWGVILWENLM